MQASKSSVKQRTAVGQLGLEVGDDAGREIAGDGTRRRPVAGGRSGHRSSGTLAASCACGGSTLTIPGAPSETTSSGSPRPRARMSWKNAVTVSASSLEPAIRCSRTLARWRYAPCRQHRLAPLPRTQPFGDPVDEQVGDVVFGEIPARKLLVVRPQARADLRDRGARQQESSALVAERVLDVAHRKAAGEELDGQVLQGLRLPLQ